MTSGLLDSSMAVAASARARGFARARWDEAVRLTALATLWLSLLLVSYWWAADGGFQDLGGWATGLTSAGRLTGLLSADLLLAQVLVMARVPLLERAYGQDRLAVIHRWVGLSSFNLMVVHLVLITWGYGAGSVGAFPSTLWNLVITYPGMLLAAAGTVAVAELVDCVALGGAVVPRHHHLPVVRRDDDQRVLREPEVTADPV